MSDMIGQQLGSYRIDSVLGSGAMGVVYKATHVTNGRTAAVKLIPAGASNTANAALRFKREAEILKQLKHPSIVRFHAVGMSAGTRYFAMEYIEGTNLEKVIDEKEFLPWREVVDLGAQLCEALQYAHERGVVHRDLKPANVMLTSENRVKLTDFGIAKDLDATQLTATGRTLGTAAYMAPEQIRGTPEVSHKTDLYALGCLLYQMLTGSIPFRGAQVAVLMNCHLNEAPPRPSSKNPEVPRALDDLVVKMMAKAPADRPWDAQLVLQTLQDLSGQLDRGETIRMVFGPSGAGAAGVAGPPLPTRIGPTNPGAAGSFDAVKKAPRKKKTRKSREVEGSKVGNRLVTAGLVAVLIALVGTLYYLLQPPTAEELYAKARPLLASTKVVDWQDADRLYLQELDRRYPDHPFRAEVDEVRDKIALYKAEAIAKRLEGPLAKEPNEVEGYYVRAARLAEDARKAGDQPFEAKIWGDLAAAVARHFPDEHGWRLLAEKRASEIVREVNARRQAVTDLIATATAAEAVNKSEVARGIWGSILRDYGKYPELRDYIASRRPANLDIPESRPDAEPESSAPPSDDSPGP